VAVLERIPPGRERVVRVALDLVRGRPIDRDVLRVLTDHDAVELLRWHGFERDNLTREAVIDLCLREGAIDSEHDLAGALETATREQIPPDLYERLAFLKSDIERRALEILGFVPDDATIERMVERAYAFEDDDLPWVEGIALLCHLRRIAR
jgi:hypothetical protein